MNYIRVNKLLRMGDLTIENLSSIMGMDISPNDKLVVINYDKTSTDDLLEMKNNIHAVLNDRLAELEKQCELLRQSINHPVLPNHVKFVEQSV